MGEAALINGVGATEDEVVETPAARATRRLLRRKGAAFGLFVIALFVALALVAPLISPYDPNLQTWTAVRKAPSALHWFGTDDVGRDVLARVIYGARASLLAGVISVAIALLVGVPIGIICGYMGGFVDAMIAIGITTTPIFIRLTRAQVMAVKVEDYVEAARAVGNPHWRIALVHILPNVLPALLVQATLSIAAAIIAEASLSFLGLGQQPP